VSQKLTAILLACLPNYTVGFFYAENLLTMSLPPILENVVSDRKANLLFT